MAAGEDSGHAYQSWHSGIFSSLFGYCYVLRIQTYKCGIEIILQEKRMCIQPHTQAHTCRAVYHKQYQHPVEKLANNKQEGAANELRISKLRPNRPYWSQITPNYEIAIGLSSGAVTSFISWHFFSGASNSIGFFPQYHFLSPLLSNKYLSLGFFTVPSISCMNLAHCLRSPFSLPRCYIHPMFPWSRGFSTTGELCHHVSISLVESQPPSPSWDPLLLGRT